MVVTAKQTENAFTAETPSAQRNSEENLLLESRSSELRSAPALCDRRPPGVPIGVPLEK
jgi:hypothetical protein